jgi:hypothetical protein
VFGFSCILCCTLLLGHAIIAIPGILQFLEFFEIKSTVKQLNFCNKLISWELLHP